MVEFSNEAIADLSAIRDRIAVYDPQIAAKTSAALAESFEVLDEFPRIGTLYADPLRYFGKDLWVIAYRPTETGVYVYRVFDSRQNWRGQLQ